jgi:AcrR family transcriptional regulator
MAETAIKDAPARTYPIASETRKARGYGHERPEEILCAARALFLEHGVENVTTRQIAARVGISQTALYVYFKSKDEMLDKLVNAALRKLGAALNAVNVRCSEPEEFLRQNFREYTASRSCCATVAARRRTTSLTTAIRSATRCSTR